MKPNIARRAGALLAFALAYAGTIVLGYRFFFESEAISAFWPASGLLLGALLVSRTAG